MSWICCWTQPLREDVADAQLRARGFETLYLTRLRRVHSHGSPWVRTPLFKRYVFAATDGPWQQLRRIRGVQDVVRVGVDAATLPAPVIAELKSRANPDGLMPTPAIRPGSSYMIVNGNPLAGLLILVERVGGEHARGWVGTWKTKIPLADLDPEPVMTTVELSRETLPLERRRKVRDWTPIG
jgi:hypothetical protein